MTVSYNDETLKYYNEKTTEFYDSTVCADLTLLYDRFLKEVCTGGKILDFGCGSGRDAKAFKDRGYEVEAIDGSVELCKLASGYAGIEVRCIDFFDIKEKEKYDGIWACASLLHIERKRLPEIIKLLRDALVTNGVIYMSFKYGDFSGMRNERYFTDLNEELAKEIIEQIDGLKNIDMWESYDVRREKDVRWLNLLLRKI
ncbi:MAG: class I SAM-dependent methyltransferase [Eubacterium sp.]|nr:class I SAM-dependent methyltransferase [Eubacterium sp.]